jgi:lysozyme family protein
MKALILAVFLISPMMSFAETCTYSILKDSVEFKWTGFKYTEKTAVSGTFDKIEFSQNSSSESIADLMKSLSFEVHTDSINSGNPARDATLQKTVFAFLKVPQKISGKVTSATTKEAVAQLMINEPTQVILSLDAKDGKLKAKGNLDLMKNGLKKSYDAVHQACEGLHTGSDGVSKTWSTVEIEIKANYDSKCSKGLMDSIKSWFS